MDDLKDLFANLGIDAELSPAEFDPPVDHELIAAFAANRYAMTREQIDYLMSMVASFGNWRKALVDKLLEGKSIPATGDYNPPRPKFLPPTTPEEVAKELEHQKIDRYLSLIIAGMVVLFVGAFLVSVIWHRAF